MTKPNEINLSDWAFMDEFWIMDNDGCDGDSAKFLEEYLKKLRAEEKAAIKEAEIQTQLWKDCATASAQLVNSEHKTCVQKARAEVYAECNGIISEKSMSLTYDQFVNEVCDEMQKSADKAKG